MLLTLILWNCFYSSDNIFLFFLFFFLYKSSLPIHPRKICVWFGVNGNYIVLNSNCIFLAMLLRKKITKIFFFKLHYFYIYFHFILFSFIYQLQCTVTKSFFFYCALLISFVRLWLSKQKLNYSLHLYIYIYICVCVRVCVCVCVCAQLLPGKQSLFRT